MAFLDEIGLQTLWNKIKSTFLTAISTNVSCTPIMRPIFSDSFGIIFSALDSNNTVIKSMSNTFNIPSSTSISNEVTSTYFPYNTTQLLFDYVKNNTHTLYFIPIDANSPFIQPNFICSIPLPNQCFLLYRMSYRNGSGTNRKYYVEIDVAGPEATCPRSIGMTYSGETSIELFNNCSPGSKHIEAGVSSLSGYTFYNYPVPNMKIVTPDNVETTAQIVSGPPYNMMGGVLSYDDQKHETTFTASAPDTSEWETEDTGEQDLTANLVASNGLGVAQTIDMKPILANVGGKVIEAPDNDNLTPVLIDSNGYIGITTFMSENDRNTYNNGAEPTFEISSDRTTASYISDLAGSTYFDFWFESGESPYNVYLLRHPTDFTFTCGTLQEAIAAGSTGVPLYKCRNDEDTGIIIVIGRATLVVTAEEYNSGQAVDFQEYTISFKIYEPGVKPVIRMEPSCDHDIDISPVIKDNLIEAYCGFTCEGIEHLVPATANVTCSPSPGYTNLTSSGADQSTMSFTLPSGTTSVFFSYVDHYNDKVYYYESDGSIPVSAFTPGYIISTFRSESDDLNLE